MIFIIANLNTKYKSLCFGIMKNNYIEELIISDNSYFKTYKFQITDKTE